MEVTFSGAAIKYNKSRAITLIKISFSYKHSIIVSLYLFAISRSCFAIRPRLKRERYLEFASFTETNFVRTFSEYCLRVGLGGIVIKHWKHSKRTAFAPFLITPLTFAQTPS